MKGGYYSRGGSYSRKYGKLRMLIHVHVGTSLGCGLASSQDFFQIDTCIMMFSKHHNAVYDNCSYIHVYASFADMLH